MAALTDLLTVIGCETYKGQAGDPAAALRNEAARCGISRRGQPMLPAGIVFGMDTPACPSTRVYCVFEAGHDAFPKLCRKCGHKLPKVKEVPYPDTLACSACKQKHDVVRGKAGQVLGYFCPDAVEVVITCSDKEAQDAVKMLSTLGIIHAVEQDARTHRVKVTGTDADLSAMLTGLKGVQNAQAVLQAHAVQIKAGARVVVVAMEPERGCGYRKNGGTYLVTPTLGNISPYHELPAGVKYVGQSFRGFKVVPPLEAAALRGYTSGGLDITGERDLLAELGL